MALKYWFEFTDVKEILHRVEISNVDFVGASTQIYGSCNLEYSETDDTLEAVRGSGLRIDLEANTSLTFSDLYSEEERTFSVSYVRNSETLFNGWLSPEGIYESLVSDKWLISLDCTDGLGFFKNLSYVEESTGLNFVGKQSLLEIVVNCLKRTKITQNIYTNIDIIYNGLTSTLDVLDNVYLNAYRFIKDDGNVNSSEGTIMSCDEVIRSVLEPFGAVLLNYKGSWVVFKPNTLAITDSNSYFHYDEDGVAKTPTKVSLDFSTDLGSQINDYYPHHVNANQQKTINSSIGAYRINYKYGIVKALLENIYLISNSDTDLIDYTILDGSYLTFPLDRRGVFVDSESTITETFKTENPLNIVADTSLTAYFKYHTDVLSSFTRFQVKFTGDSTTVYYLKQENKTSGSSTSRDNIYNASWSTSIEYLEGFSKVEFTTQEQSSSISYNTDVTPENGDLEIIVFTGGNKFFTPTGNAEVKQISLKVSGAGSIVVGENHNFQRETKPSSKIKDTQEVFNGDNPSDIYVGTIYKADEITPTSTWNRKGIIELKPILQIMGEERMKIYSKPLQVYSGDVFGFIEYLSVVSIDGLTGKFMPTSYNYDALNNITTLTLKEILDSDILDDVDYTITFDYGNVVEPTIRG